MTFWAYNQFRFKCTFRGILSCKLRFDKALAFCNHFTTTSLRWHFGLPGTHCYKLQYFTDHITFFVPNNSLEKWLHNWSYSSNRSKQIQESHTAFIADTQYTQQRLNLFSKLIALYSLNLQKLNWRNALWEDLDISSDRTAPVINYTHWLFYQFYASIYTHLFLFSFPLNHLLTYDARSILDVIFSWSLLCSFCDHFSIKINK